MPKNYSERKIKMKTWQIVALAAGGLAVAYFLFKEDKEDPKTGMSMSVAKPKTGSGWS